MKNQPLPRARRGFSLVITMTLMVLLLLLSVGLLSLSSITLRAAGTEKDMATARANARMALILAIGDLQKYAGPDQRVTAPARILDKQPQSPDADGVSAPEWVGVWSTTEDASDVKAKPYISRGTNPENPTLVDSRAGKRPNQLAFLVSGDPQTADVPRAANNGVTMVSAGDGAGREVWVPTVGITSAAGGAANTSNGGKFGYWVKDVSTATPLALRGGYDKSLQPTVTTPANGGYSKLLSPDGQTAGVLHGLESLSALKKDDCAKVFTMQSASLVGDAEAIKGAMKTRMFHSVGEMGYGVMTDTLRGGLRADLSAFLKSNGNLASDSVGSGLSDDTPIVEGEGLRRFAPKFGLLRSYWGMADKLSGSFAAPRINLQMPQMRSDQYCVERQNRTKMQVTPVVTDYSMMFEITYHPANRSLNLMVFPRVTLYNPYNVTIAAQPYHVQIINRVYMNFTVPLINQTNPLSPVAVNQSFTYDNYFGYNPAYGVGGRGKDLCFYLEATELAPGEALVFTPQMSAASNVLNGVSGQLNFPSTGNLNQNVLSARVPVSNLTSFYHQFATLPVNHVLANASNPSYTIKRYWDNGFHFGYGMAMGLRLRASTGGAAMPAAMAAINSGWPVIQCFDSDNWFRQVNGRWRDNTDPPHPLRQRDQFLTSGGLPYQRTQFGMRYKWFQETNNNLSANPGRNWNAAPLACYDLRSPVSHRNPWDNIISTANPNEFAYGQYAIDTYAPPWTDAQTMPISVGGKNRISPFYSSTQYAGNTFPVFDLPRKELPPISMAQLRHAQLSAFSYWPSFIIGESYASPSVRRKDTAWTSTELGAAWQSGNQQWSKTAAEDVCYWWERNSTGGGLQPRDFTSVFDVAYEVNHGLWDAYYLSGLTGSENGWNNQGWDDANPMPNPRLVADPYDLQYNQKDVMTGFRRGARAMMIKAPFNVNTADKDAWAALLKSFRGVNVPTRNTAGGVGEDMQAFSRDLVPDSPGVNGIAASTSNSNWNAFQMLSDEKVDLLAERIVSEVKQRGPFISISDFVNRRLVEGGDNPASETDTSRTGLAGALQAALDDPSVGINNFTSDCAMPQDIRSSVFPLVNSDGGVETRGYGPHNPQGKSALSPGFVSQGDVLAKIGSVLTARGDTFTIRAYGEARSGDAKKVTARVWCEATVQRLPSYLDSNTDLPEVAPANLMAKVNRVFGRRYELVSFRWLSPNEI